jgi:nucleoside-diphosphate-sugar epimerase
LTKYKTIKIGVTGASGVLGKALCIKLKKYDLYKFNKNIVNKKSVYKWVEKNNFDAVIHLAAIVPTIEVDREKYKALKVNYLGTKYLIDALIKNKNKK